MDHEQAQLMTRWGQGRNPTLRYHATRQLPMYCTTCHATQRLELDHIVPLSQGGTDTLDNAQWLCHRCHARKTGRESAAGRRYLRPPERHPGIT